MNPNVAVRPSANPREELSRIALDTYLAAILSMAEAVETACPPAGPYYREQLMRLRKRAAFKPSPESLGEAREALDRELASFAEQTRRYCQLKAQDVEVVLQALNELLPAAAGGPLSKRLAEINEHIRGIQQTPPIDPLTGLPRASELARELEAHISEQRQFCIMFFRIDDLRRFTDSLGRVAGDQILQRAAERLRDQVRPHDFVCRWNDNEFVVIMECGLRNASARIEQIGEVLQQPYSVLDGSHEYRIEIAVRGGVVERRTGEAAEQLLARSRCQVAELAPRAVVA